MDAQLKHFWGDSHLWLALSICNEYFRKPLGTTLGARGLWPGPNSFSRGAPCDLIISPTESMDSHKSELLRLVKEAALGC